MAIKITEECINCGACEPECPNTAIYEGGLSWKFSDGTQLKDMITLPNGNQAIAEEVQQPKSAEFYYIATDKCTECVGFHEEPQCAAVCPVDCCIIDMAHQETKNALLRKKNWMHQ